MPVVRDTLRSQPLLSTHGSMSTLLNGMTLVLCIMLASSRRSLLVKEAVCIWVVAKKDGFSTDMGVELHDCWIAAAMRRERTGQHHQK